jgi:hypothetical protein
MAQRGRAALVQEPPPELPEKAGDGDVPRAVAEAVGRSDPWRGRGAWAMLAPQRSKGDDA